jgi:hypothetical protein
MENTQLPTTHQPDDIFGIAFDEATRVQIKQAAQWAKITALCAFIGYGVVLISLFSVSEGIRTVTPLAPATYGPATCWA